MKFKVILLTFFPIIAACSLSSPQKDKTKIDYVGTEILVIKNIEIARSAKVSKAIREECKLTKKLTRYIDEYAADQYAQILTNTNLATVPADTLILKIQIDQVMDSSSSAWNGTNTVAINGKLIKNTQILGDFNGRRTFDPGVLGMYKNTCTILGECVKALGKDIAAWLIKPGAQGIIGDY